MARSIEWYEACCFLTSNCWPELNSAGANETSLNSFSDEYVNLLSQYYLDQNRRDNILSADALARWHDCYSTDPFQSHYANCARKLLNHIFPAVDAAIHQAGNGQKSAIISKWLNWLASINSALHANSKLSGLVESSFWTASPELANSMLHVLRQGSTNRPASQIFDLLVELAGLEHNSYTELWNDNSYRKALWLSISENTDTSERDQLIEKCSIHVFQAIRHDIKKFEHWIDVVKGLRSFDASIAL